jgi:transposase
MLFMNENPNVQEKQGFDISIRSRTRIEYGYQVALAAIKGDKTVAELSQQFDVHANQITQWKNQLLERAGVVFEGSGHHEAPPIDLKALHAKIGELTLENDFLEGALTKAGLLSAKR